MLNYKTSSILNVKISLVTRKQLISDLNSYLCSSSKKQNLIVSTVNPSFILKAQSDSEFMSFLNEISSINTPDGVGIQFANEYISKVQVGDNFLKKVGYGINLFIDHVFYNKQFSISKEKISGVYIVKNLLDISCKEKLSVLILHKKNSLLSRKELTSHLKNKYPTLNFSVVNVSPNSDKHFNKHYDIVLCTLGEVAQELYLSSIKSNFIGSVLIGIGGTFDVLFKYKNCDSITDQSMFDWVTRLLNNPKRIMKVVRSVVIFPIKVFLHSLSV